MALPSLTERMALARRNQVRALAGERIRPMPVRAANESTHSVPAEVAEVSRPLDTREGMLCEVERLLPAIARHYGYEGDDVAFVRKTLQASDNQEIAACVYQWRIDAATHDLVGIPPAAALRAWAQFRQSVMGKTADEAGLPYSADSVACPAEPTRGGAGPAPAAAASAAH